MFNFDMVGRLEREQLQVFGTATASEFLALLHAKNRDFGFKLTATGDGFGRSDHSSFYAKGVPVLHFFSGTHADYHRASDDAERINAAGEARIIDFAHAVLRDVADRPARLTFVRAAASVALQLRAGRGAYLGSIPDMAAGDGSGLRLTGVRTGSPAEVGGLRADDVIVEFGGKAVGDLYAYTDAIAAFAPGDTVRVIVQRSGQRVPLTIVLGRRGS
jgi:C-terminal processing protease CtpA/Prc